jgi:parvulin-like peptidyl-prolyl isomerase
VEESEIRAYWEENRESFPPLPTRLKFEEVPVTLTASEAARAAAREEAERALEELGAGRDFAAVARQFSDDSVSAEQDGDLGWFGRGRMVPAFEEAAFSAVPGEVVGPVESAYGWHLIQVLDQRGEEVRARHVLIAFEMGPDDRVRARSEAEEIRDRLVAGADVDSLQAARMPGDEETAAPIEIDATQLPPAYATSLEGLEPGGVAVVETPTGFSVVMLLGTSGGEPPTYELMAPRIRQQLARQKAEDAFVERLQEEIYVDVRLRPEEVL